MFTKNTVLVIAVVAMFVLAIVFLMMRKKETYTPGNSFTTVKGRILNISEDYKRFQIIFWRRCNGRKIRTKYIFNTITPQWHFKKRQIVKVSYRNWGKCEPVGFIW